MSDRPKIAFWFRYGPAEHAELFHAIPDILATLARTCEVHYFGMRTAKPIPSALTDILHLHLLPFTVRRASAFDKALKTLLWLLAIPFLALRCRRLGIRAVYIDETIPLSVPLARLFFRGPLALTVADMFTDIYLTGCLAPLGHLIRALDLRAWRQCPLLFTRANATKTWLVSQGIPPDAVHPVYDPCDFSLFHPLPLAERETARTALGYAPSDLVLVHHGILHPNKGNRFILRAIAALHSTCPELRFLLVGDGPEMSALRRLADELRISSICTFTGWLPTPADVNRALNAADIGLVMRTGAPSDDFHMTGALVHSMACALPVLAARLGGVSEVIRDGVNGCLFNPADPADFQNHLLHLIRTPAIRATLARAAATDARQLFDLPTVTAHTVTPLLHLLTPPLDP